MAGNRRLTVLLGILTVLLAVAVYVNWPAPVAPSAPQLATSTAPSRPVAVPPRSGGGAPTEVTAPDVHTEALREARPRPGDVSRNLFAFKPKYVPPPPQVAQAPRPASPSGPPPPPQVPPIGLKFIGILEPPAGGRIAILSDGRGAPIYGKEGEALLGQYRILRIGMESIELEYIDGRGRQAIRLSGS